MKPLLTISLNRIDLSFTDHHSRRTAQEQGAARQRRWLL
jgi:hypothetical protein